MNIRMALFLMVLLFVADGCTKNSTPPDFSFVVYTTKKQRYEVVALVEQFVSKENLYQLRNVKAPEPDADMFSISFADEAQKNSWVFVSNGNLKNKDHVAVEIFTLSPDKRCYVCNKFKDSTELKIIREKFKTSEVVKNGNW